MSLWPEFRSKNPIKRALKEANDAHEALTQQPNNPELLDWAQGSAIRAWRLVKEQLLNGSNDY